MHKEFVERAIAKTKTNPNCIGLAIGGSWINNQIDEFSDIDFVLITEKIMSDDFKKMHAYAESIGDLINDFTGEHVGEKRLLICLYDNPLLHVDIKFITRNEFQHRVENPIVVWDRDGSIQNIIVNSTPTWPKIDRQWIEDRFWTWIHYATLKLGRGEYFEAIDCISSIRAWVLSPLMQLKNSYLPRGLRKVEQTFSKEDKYKLEKTVPAYSKESIVMSLENSISLYQDLKNIFIEEINPCLIAEERSIAYFHEIKNRVMNR